MAELHRCATCGNVLSGTLDGQCPACLLKGGMAGSAAAAPGSETVPYQSQPGEVRAPSLSALPRPGQEFGAYHIVRVLGQGGMGAVFEAEEHDTGRRLALKVLNHSLDSPGARQRFLFEGRLAAKLNHPQSVYVFGSDEIQGAPVIAMELIQGGTLQDRVRAKGPMPIQEAVDAILQVVDGLEAAHAVGVLHRDVKPANCFVDAEGRIKIGDFGLSIPKEGRGDLQLTLSGVFLGTPTFASPEQLRGDELDARSDLYAVGVTLYYLLTGKVPFEAASMVQLVAKVLEKPAPDVRTLRSEVPRALALVIQCCLAKEPKGRYRSYADLRSALLPFSSLLPVPASPFRRFAADCIDKGITTPLHSLLMLLLGLSSSLHPVVWLMGFGMGFVYYILPEGLAGATLGKWLLGLRVVRDGQRQPPGVLRAGVRALVFHYVPLLPFGLFMLAYPDTLGADGQANLTGTSLAWFMVAALGLYVLLGLLFCTMRRSNGYAGVHDLLSGTRVIARPTLAHRPILLKPQETSDEPAPTTSTIGPYHVLANLGSNAAGDWRLGYDPRLFRKVWLCVVPAGTPTVPAARQNIGRPGRLRWLAGRRGPQENWDAFEAPTGQALWQLLDGPHDWRHVGFWLLDLSEELASALKDGTLPETLGLESVWITADGRAMLLDQEIPHPKPLSQRARGEGFGGTSIATQPGDVEPVKGFLHQVAVATLHGRRIGYDEAQSDAFAFPLPLHVRTVVEGLKKVQRPEVAAAQLQTVLAKPTRVTKTRRAGILACCVGISFLLSFSVFGMVMYTIGLTKAAAPELIDLQNALQWHSPIFNRAKPTDEQTKALEIYLAGTHRERINDPDTWTDPYMAKHVQAQQQKAVKEIVARTPPPTEEELKNALAVVMPRLDSRRSGNVFESMNPLVLLSILFTVSTLQYLAFPSVLCALVFRGGLLWRMFGITAVTRNGQPARRWRVCWRNLVAWSPMFVLPIAMVMLAPLVDDVSVPIICLAVAYAALALASTLAGQRSLPDRLAGTWLVIR